MRGVFGECSESNITLKDQRSHRYVMIYELLAFEDTVSFSHIKVVLCMGRIFLHRPTLPIKQKKQGGVYVKEKIIFNTISNVK